MASLALRMQEDRLRYAAMQPREILIWKNWLKANVLRFDRYEYNVRLGTGVDPGPTYEISSRRMWIANTMRRADVIAVVGQRVTIIEVEENPGIQAFGQLQGYSKLYRDRVRRGGPPTAHVELGVEEFFPKDLPFDPDPALLLVCARIGNDAISVAEGSGVRFEVVPTDFSELKRRA